MARSEQRNKKDLAKLARFRERVAGRQCTCPDCFQSTMGGARFCSKHQGKYLQTGNPLTVIPTIEDYQEDIESVKGLLKVNPNHPATRAGIKWLKQWQARSILAIKSREPGHVGFRTFCPAERAAVLSIRRRVRLSELLVTLGGAFAYMQRTDRCNTMPCERARVLAIVALRVIGNNEDAKGYRHSWHNGTIRELGKMLSEGGFMKLCVTLSEGVAAMKAKELKLVQAFGRPLAVPQMYRPTRTIKPFTFYAFEEVATHTE
jgi:hypothetical protein